MRTAAVLAASALLTGCHLFGDSQEELQRWSGPISDFRVSWDAEPGIEVQSGAAVPVRAFVESTTLTQYMGDLDYAYPGFVRAVPEDGPQRELWSRRTSLGEPLSHPLVGTEYFTILSIRRNEQNTAVIVCDYRYAIGAQQENGQFRSAGRNGVGDGRGIEAIQVGLIEPPPGSSSLPPRAGPLPAPTDDVFGDWQVLGLLGFFSKSKPGFDAQWPTYEQDVASCIEKAPMPPERRAFLVDGEHPRSDFPTSPATPGWPGES